MIAGRHLGSAVSKLLNAWNFCTSLNQHNACEQDGVLKID